MDHNEVENLEEKLSSLLVQLQTEFGILDRIVYKGKNQHRHGRYFQYLSKVRSDLRILLSMGLKDILKFLFQILNGNKPSQMLYLLERLKKNKSYNKKPNFMEQLLGAARLLSDMVEPMLKAAEQISCLLARSFFTGFCLAILAVLARLRVLIQQILIDIISVFNAISSLSQRKHSVKLTHEGAEIIREYYPSTGDISILECKLEGDKFVLLEKVCPSKAEGVPGEAANIQMEAPELEYSTLAGLNEGSSTDGKNDTKLLFISGQTGSTTNMDKLDTDSSSHQPLMISSSVVVNQCNIGSLGDDQFMVGGSADANRSRGLAPESPTPTQPRKMAFVQVRKPTSESSISPPSKRIRVDQFSTSNFEDKDSLYNLFADGDVQDSIFWRNRRSTIL